MKRLFKCLAIPALLLTMILLLCFHAAATEPGDRATILFTHDLHSHLLPALNEAGEEYGGYARLKTAIDAERKKDPNAILVDGGDFSMGTLFQTAFSTSATELRVMGALGYDVTTLGNHEYDYRASGLAKMLNAAVKSGDPLPAIVEANYLPPEEGEKGYDEDAGAVWDAFENYGVKDYILLERGGVHYAIIGVLGVDSDECAPMSGMILHDHVKTTQRAVNEAVDECVETYGVMPVVIVLSHAGTSGGKGEDYELAKEVDGIDLIISGHTHTKLTKPIEVDGTYIVSAQEYGKYLGKVTVGLEAGGGVSNVIDYQLIPINDTLEDDPEIAKLVEGYKAEVDKGYLRQFGLKFDQVLADSPFAFESLDAVGATQHESTLGNLLSDSYLWAAQEALGGTVDAAFTAVGVIRSSFPEGEITVSDVFDLASLGIGADGVPGYPLVSVWLTGSDLKNVLEVDASVQPLMSAAQLFSSGVEYSFNTKRMIFNKVDYAALRRTDGTVEEIRDDELYRIVTGLYCGQMLGAVKDKSFGLLSVIPRDAAGKPVDMNRLEDYIVYDAEGREVKEWYAIASYLQTMDGTVEEKYEKPDGRKMIYQSLAPADLLRNANQFTWIVVALILMIVLIVVLIIRVVRVRNRRNGKRRKNYRGK